MTVKFGLIGHDSIQDALLLDYLEGALRNA